MGEITLPLPVKLICAIIYNNDDFISKAEKLLTKKFGPVELSSQIFEFNFTDYYVREMGKDLKRKFLAFKKLVPSEQLVKIKIDTNLLEKRISRRPTSRDINIDPGYITLSKLVLATTKNFVHRIYVGKGIFEEVTLYFKNNTFNPGRWTYPDYRTDSHISFFNNVRDRYYTQIEETYGHSKLYKSI